MMVIWHLLALALWNEYVQPVHLWSWLAGVTGAYCAMWLIRRAWRGE